jgi:hypothetical protein
MKTTLKKLSRKIYKERDEAFTAQIEIKKNSAINILQRKINPYDFVKFNFFKDVMSLRNPEFFVMGVVFWCVIATIILLGVWVTTLIFQL